MSNENLPTSSEPTTPPTLLTQPTVPPTTPTEPAAPAEPAKIEPAATPEPLTVESLKAPEGMEIPAAEAEKFIGILSDDKLSPGDRANALLSLQSEVAKGWAEKSTAAFNDFWDQQVEAVKSDPEIGGAKLEPALAKISSVLNEYGSPELREVLNVTRVGDSPAVVKFLAKIADVLSEGAPVRGTPAPVKSLEETFYPSMKKG